MLYVILRALARWLFLVLCGMRAYRRPLPTGGFVIASNHQSYIDPVLLGGGLERRLSFMARDTLFDFPLFGGVIRRVGAFPVRREGVGKEGLQEAVRRLRSGEAVVVFPEGTRSRTGEIGRMKDGAGLLSRLADVPVVPAAVSGTYEVWPRGRPFPLPARVKVAYGKAIPAARFREDPQGALAELEHSVRELHQDLLSQTH